MPSPPDPYELLGVPRRAPMSEVQRAFRRQVLRWHPDLHPHRKLSEQRFREVVNAYRTISRGRRERSGAPPDVLDGDWPLWAKATLYPRIIRGPSWASRAREQLSAFIVRHMVAVSLSFSASSATGVTAVGLIEPPIAMPSPPGELNRAYAQKVYASHNDHPADQVLPSPPVDER